MIPHIIYSAEDRKDEAVKIVDLEAFGRETWQVVMDADMRGRQLLLRELIDRIVVNRIGKQIRGTIHLKGLFGDEMELEL